MENEDSPMISVDTEIPSDLHAQIQKKADAEGLSFDEYAARAIKREIASSQSAKS